MVIIIGTFHFNNNNNNFIKLFQFVSFLSDWQFASSLVYVKPRKILRRVLFCFEFKRSINQFSIIAKDQVQSSLSKLVKERDKVSI